MVYYFVRLCLVMIYFPFRKINRWFLKNKIIIHSDVDLLESLTLKRLHCREMDTLAFDYATSDVASTHTINSVKQAYQHQLDYVFMVIFTTASKPNQQPRCRNRRVTSSDSSLCHRRLHERLPMALQEFVQFLIL